MESKLKNIKHELQDIKVSKYEQHCESGRPERVLKNVYFKPRGTKPGEERTQDLNSTVTGSDFMSRFATTLFDLFAYEIDKNVVLDKEGYKNEIKKSIDDDSLKIICKQHKILKRDLHNFIDASEYEIPTNSNVISFFSNLMHTHFFLAIGEQIYTVWSKPRSQDEISQDGRNANGIGQGRHNDRCGEEHDQISSNGFQHQAGLQFGYFPQIFIERAANVQFTAKLIAQLVER